MDCLANYWTYEKSDEACASGAGSKIKSGRTFEVLPQFFLSKFIALVLWYEKNAFLYI